MPTKEFTIIDTSNTDTDDKKLIKEYFNKNGFTEKLLVENEYNFQLYESKGLCQIWTMFNVYYFIRGGLEQVKKNYEYLILLKNRGDDKYKLIMIILLTWVHYNIKLTRNTMFFKSNILKPKKSVKNLRI